MKCPQCGSEIILHSSLSTLVNCNHCGSTLLIEPTGLQQTEIESHIQDKLSLIKKGHKFIWRGRQFHPQGFVQLKHDEGYRKEWWVLDEQENTYWLSEEDENFFLLQDTTLNNSEIPAWMSLQLNKQLKLANKNWLVTEKREYQFYGIQGELAYLPDQDTSLQSIHLTGDNAESLVLTFKGAQIRIRQGHWLDPFEIEAIA